MATAHPRDGLVGKPVTRPSRAVFAAPAFTALAACTIAFLPADSAAEVGDATVPLVSDFTLAPDEEGWRASVTVVDLAGGGSLRALDVRLKGGGLTEFTRMLETADAGRYEVALPRMRPGTVRLALRLRALGDSAGIAGFDETYERRLPARRALQVVGSPPVTARGDGPDRGMLAAGAGALLTVAVTCSVLAVRSRA